MRTDRFREDWRILLNKKKSLTIFESTKTLNKSQIRENLIIFEIGNWIRNDSNFLYKLHINQLVKPALKITK